MYASLCHVTCVGARLEHAVSVLVTIITRTIIEGNPKRHNPNEETHGFPLRRLNFYIN